MSQVGTPTDPNALSTVPHVPETDPFADLSGMFGDLGAMLPASTGAEMGQIETLTSEIITQLTVMSPDAQAAAADSFANLFTVVAEHVATVDLADPAAVADLQASFSQMMAMAMNGQDTTSVEFAMLAGIADSAYAAVTIAASDPALAETVIEMVTGTFGELSGTFPAASSGPADFVAVNEGALDELLTLYEGLVGLGGENGIEITSLSMEQLSPVDDSMAPVVEEAPTGTSEMTDLLGDLGPDTEDPTAELPTDETGVDEMLNDGKAAEMDDLLGELGLDSEGAEATDEVVAEDGAESGGLSEESSTDGDPSAENQANLEARYIGLYESLMEKQISFKEAIEPYKTDNQNAGKG